jgi:hypothetical protein
MVSDRAFERILSRLHRWRDAVDRDRDLVALEMRLAGVTPFLEAWLEQLDLERVRVEGLLTRLSAERHDPALLFPVRPRPLRMVLLRRPARRRGDSRSVR